MFTIILTDVSIAKDIFYWILLDITCITDDYEWIGNLNMLKSSNEKLTLPFRIKMCIKHDLCELGSSTGSQQTRKLSANVSTMWNLRIRRWPSIVPTLVSGTFRVCWLHSTITGEFFFCSFHPPWRVQTPSIPDCLFSTVHMRKFDGSILITLCRIVCSSGHIIIYAHSSRIKIGNVTHGQWIIELVSMNHSMAQIVN